MPTFAVSKRGRTALAPPTSTQAPRRLCEITPIGGNARLHFGTCVPKGHRLNVVAVAKISMFYLLRQSVLDISFY
jgi:hypothetical protein